MSDEDEGGVHIVTWAQALSFWQREEILVRQYRQHIGNDSLMMASDVAVGTVFAPRVGRRLLHWSKQEMLSGTCGCEGKT